MIRRESPVAPETQMKCTIKHNIYTIVFDGLWRLIWNNGTPWTTSCDDEMDSLNHYTNEPSMPTVQPERDSRVTGFDFL